MPRISQFGLWTCAGLYFAVGLCGILFFGLAPNGGGASDGYGVIHATPQIAQR